jgi:hypothetical protein
LTLPARSEDLAQELPRAGILRLLEEHRGRSVFDDNAVLGEVDVVAGNARKLFAGTANLSAAFDPESRASSTAGWRCRGAG